MDRIEREKSSKPEKSQSVLRKLLKIDKEIAVIMALDMIAAGIDTTSATIKNLLYLLAVNPERQARLRAEILTILPAKTDRLTTEKISHMPYLRACMKESQRVIPTVGGNLRRTPTNLVLQGYRIPDGTDIVLPHGIISNQEEFFPRSRDFVPERWLKDVQQAEAVGCPHAKFSHPFAYMPFGFGNRACIGKRFAELETAILIMRLVREFEISWHYPEPKRQFTIIQTVAGDLKFRFKEITN